MLGTPLQFGSMFADGPVIGGRFYGFGNSTFATLAVAALVTAGLGGAKAADKGRTQAALAAGWSAAMAIIVDGIPGWGTDLGGIIALTPAVLLMAWLTWRGSISWRALLGIGDSGLSRCPRSRWWTICGHRRTAVTSAPSSPGCWTVT